MKSEAAVALGKLGGSVKSEAKARAARENGKKGGRPKNEVTVTCSKCKKPMQIEERTYKQKWGKEFRHRDCYQADMRKVENKGEL